jgi:transcription initiation factor TFIIIB Brf1 subunit/transcription initiation factor TFIIB
VASNLPKEISLELEFAVAVRAAGNEGKARVHARRAAGWAIKAWRERHGYSNKGISAFAYLQGVSTDLSVPRSVREAAANLVLRITSNHELPIETDVLDDARLIVTYCIDMD